MICTCLACILPVADLVHSSHSHFRSDLPTARLSALYGTSIERCIECIGIQLYVYVEYVSFYAALVAFFGTADIGELKPLANHKCCVRSSSLL